MRFSPCSARWLLLLTVIIFAATASAGTWNGKEITQDGALHIMNPASPIEAPSTTQLRELWRVGGDDESDDVIFGVLVDITTDDDGNVYVLDTQLNEISIYSPGGEYLRTIGREGEGPGEFRRPQNLFVTGDGRIAVLQAMPGKIILLTKNGDAAGNHPLPESEGLMMFSGGRRAGDQIVLGTQQWAQKEGEFTFTTALVRVDAEGNQTASYWENSTSRNMSDMVFDERKLGGAPAWTVAADGRVLLCDDFDAYQIHVWKPDGTLDRIIERDFELRKRSKEEMANRGPKISIRTGEGAVKTEMIKSKTDRTVLGIYPRQDGTVWVLSSRGAFDTADGEIATFDVFDASGKFTQQITLRGEGNFDDDGFTFVGDRFYVLLGLSSARDAAHGGDDEAEDEELEEAEPMAVICYEFGDIVQSKR